MILVDSFGWIEFFTDGPLADKYFGYLKDESKLTLPTPKGGSRPGGFRPEGGFSGNG